MVFKGADSPAKRFFSWNCLPLGLIAFLPNTLYNLFSFPLNTVSRPINRRLIPVLETDRPTQTRIRLRIPKDLHEEPVISRLVSQHGVTVNITAALLGANGRDDGWFDLELRGRASQIQSALTYIDELDLEIWSQSTPEEDGW